MGVKQQNIVHGVKQDYQQKQSGNMQLGDLKIENILGKDHLAVGIQHIPKTQEK